jgi:hypothetical protein
MWLPVVGTGRPHKTKVHIKSLARFAGTDRRALSSLFPNTSLFFEVQKPEGMKVELRWDPCHIPW